MPDLNDFHAFNSTKGGSDGDGGSNGGRWDFGCGWVVIVIVVILLIYFIADGAIWDAIDTLLGLGFLTFLFARSLFR